MLITVKERMTHSVDVEKQLGEDPFDSMHMHSPDASDPFMTGMAYMEQPKKKPRLDPGCRSLLYLFLTRALLEIFSDLLELSPPL